MLSEQDQLLLTGLVDGELSAREQYCAEKLLRGSAEARKFLNVLREDSKSINLLTRHSIPLDMTDSVMQGIYKFGPAPKKIAPKKSRRTIAVSRAIAIAAIVLGSLGLGSYLYFNSLVAIDPDGSVVARNSETLKPSIPENINIHPGNVLVKTKDQESKLIQSIPDSNDSGKPVGSDPALAQIPPIPSFILERDLEMESPRENAGPVLTDRGLEIFEIKTADVTLPQIRSIRELTADSARIQLKNDLSRSDSFRLEFPVVDANRTLERLEGVCKSLGFSLTLDATARSRITNKSWKTNYIVYSESLSSEDIVKLVKSLGETDKQASDKKQSDNLLDRYFLAKLNNTDRRELADLLGIEPASLMPLRASGLLGTDLQKPIQDQTASQIIKSMTEQGGRKDISLLAMPFWPARPARASLEVKQFLESRKPIKPSAIQLMIVLRNVG